jgi:hypothetical protein
MMKELGAILFGSVILVAALVYWVMTIHQEYREKCEKKGGKAYIDRNLRVCVDNNAVIQID